MKNTIYILTVLICLSLYAPAQTLNWRSFGENQKHHLSVGLGMDYSIFYDLTYGYRFSAPIPFVLGTELSVPTGKQLHDDWKIKFSGQSELWHTDRWSWSVQPGLNFRRFKSEIGSISAPGLEIGTSFGYFRPKWGLAVNLNYDWIAAAHIRNNVLKDYFPEIRDGWYSSTGGNFRLGLRANYQIRAWGIYLNAGLQYGQDFRNNPTLPAYAGLGLSRML